MNELRWDVEEGKFISLAGLCYDEDTASELVEAGLAVIVDDVDELDFND